MWTLCYQTSYATSVASGLGILFIRDILCGPGKLLVECTDADSYQHPRGKESLTSIGL